MKVNLYATLSQIVGSKQVDLDIKENTTVGGLLDAVVSRYPDLYSELYDENGELYPQVHVMVNGRDAIHLKDRFDTRLTPNDLVSIFPAVGGGNSTSPHSSP